MERGELLKEYESIPRRHPAGECCVAQQPESADKNRFQDVLPYDNTRVELVPTKENNTGYINASHIKVSSAVMYHNTYFLANYMYRILFLRHKVLVESIFIPERKKTVSCFCLFDLTSDLVLMEQLFMSGSFLTTSET